MKVKKSGDLWSALPTKLVECLMPFQKEGVEFAVNKDGRCLIADEMGLGKTLQAISVAYYYRHEWPLLIIVPSSLRYCWIEEFEKWLPDINPGDINLIQSGNDISGISGSQVTITTYGLLSKSTSTVLREALMNQGFRVVIVDESHSIRNVKTVSAKVIVPLIKNATRRLLLSGTPALSRPVELYPQIDAILPNAFGSWWAYTTRYCDAKTEFIGRVRKRNVKGASNLEELQQKLSSQLMIRRQKSEVLTQLPAKVRQKVLFELKDSDLKRDIKRTFQELRPMLKRQSGENIEIVEGSGDTDAKDLDMLSMIQRLYRLSGEAKIGPAKEYTEMLCDNPDLKFLVFAYHKSMMHGLSQSLYDKNIKFIRIDGDTPPSERPQLVHQFQSDPDTRVAVLSILAAGVGLTFTAATLVVFAEMYWTPGMMVQCEDRAHRIGQTNSVSVHYLVAKDTMDEWVWSAVCKKTIVTSTTLTGKKQVMEAQAGDSYQVDVLSNAEAWVPTQNESMDLTGYFQTQLAPDQKSIHDFFTSSQSSSQSGSQPVQQTSDQSPHISSSQKSAASAASSPMLSWLASKSNVSNSENPRKRARIEPESEGDSLMRADKRSKEIVVIDSGSDAEDFVADTKSASKSSFKKRKRSNKKDSGKLVSPKNSLMAAFQKVSKGDKVVVLSDEEAERSKDTGNVKEEIRKNKTNEKTTISKMSNPNSSRTEKSAHTPKQKQLSDKNKSKWSCMACTFINHPALNKCEICDTPKKKSGDNADTCSSKDESTLDNTVEFYHDSNTNIHGTDSEADKTKESEQTNDQTKVSEASNGANGAISAKENVSEMDVEVEAESLVKGTCAINELSVVQSPKLNFIDTTHSPSHSVVSSSGKTYKFKAFRKSNSGKDATPATLTKTKSTDVHMESTNMESTSEGKDGNCEATHRSNTEKADEVHGSYKRELNEQDARMLKETRKECKKSSELHQVVTGSASINSNNDGLEKSEDGVQSGSTEVKRICNKTEEKKTDRHINLDDIPEHKLLRFQCSKYTGRVYVLDEADQPLNVNFIPMDIEVGNHDNLPDILLHPHHLRLVQKFVREWQSLTETKRRLIIKQGRTFISPLREYEVNKSCKTLNTQRHRTKMDTAVAAMKKATEVSGTLRVINRGNRGQPTESQDSSERGVTQVVTEDGTPLCVQCMKPYENQLLQKSTISDEENAWQTRFCSQTCAQEYWMVTNNDYMRDQVFEAEHGVCQMCQLDVHALFRQVRDTKDLQKRAEIISKSKLRTICIKTKEQMVKKPVAGQFWQIDHIIPVWQGGGQCDIDNLRTLCVTCHLKVTAKQAGQRATVRKLGSAVQSGDITAFFQKL